MLLNIPAGFPRFCIGGAMALVLGLLPACSSATPGGRHLYDDSQPPRLKDAEIRMETVRRLRGDKHPDLRLIRVQNGVITCSMQSRARRVKGVGEVPVREYAAIWAMIEDLGGFDQTSESPDPSGGYYHAITFRLGHRQGQTSAQNRSNFLGLGTTEIQARLTLANAITRAVENHVTLQEWTPADETPKKP